MIPLDHEKTRGKVFCPMLGAVCEGGSTKAMKGAKCAAWRALPMTDTKSNVTREVYACSAFEWPPALGFEVSGMVSRACASTDKVATEVRHHHASFVGALKPDALQRLVASDPRVVTPAIENKKDGEGE